MQDCQTNIAKYHQTHLRVSFIFGCSFALTTMRQTARNRIDKYEQNTSAYWLSLLFRRSLASISPTHCEQCGAVELSKL